VKMTSNWLAFWLAMFRWNNDRSPVRIVNVPIWRIHFQAICAYLDDSTIKNIK